MGEKQATIQIDATPEMRRGVHAEIVTATTNGTLTRLDFILTDGQNPETGDATGVLAARVFMDNASVVALKDMLERHISDWQVMEVPTNAE